MRNNNPINKEQGRRKLTADVKVAAAAPAAATPAPVAAPAAAAAVDAIADDADAALVAAFVAALIAIACNTWVCAADIVPVAPVPAWALPTKPEPNPIWEWEAFVLAWKAAC